MELRLLLLCLAVFGTICVVAQTTGFKVAQPTGFTIIASHNQSTLYTIDGTTYDPPIYLVNLKGSRYDMGFDYGYLLGHAINESYHNLMASTIPKLWEQKATEAFLDWQWDSYLKNQVPEEYFEEMRGIKDGGIAIGFTTLTLDIYIQRVVTISNFPGDIEKNIEWLLENELGRELTQILMATDLTKFKQHCSFFAAWGSRTQNGELFSMRNLDWLPDSGASKYKLITVYHPSDGTIPHATIGFAGFQGALTGMSMAGVTVHEAGNDVMQETFEGFTWSLRLRNVMENTVRVADAVSLWKATNNTLGMNHMVASAVDISEKNPHPAVALETMAGYTAYFYENDPREKLLKYKDPDTGVETHLGAPLEDAVWRTNHGYDPVVISQELVQTKPNSNSENRYMIIHDSFKYYQSVGKPIGVLEAINITSIVGDKGGSSTPDFYQCKDSNDGKNILSVTYHPGMNAGTMYVAFETGTGVTWRPACCGTYVQLDMASWWGK